MCGIFGLFLDRPLDDRDIKRGRSATKALAHRGPDGFGEWIDRDAGVYLGHTRLAIMDPKPRSDQPMVRGEHVLAYNGEIYNFKELRKKLQERGVSFETTGDAEVLLEGWRRWGQEALDQFDGMFASAIWDGEAACLAVDPFGEKPLYVADHEKGAAVASQPGVLARYFGIAPLMEGERLTSFLALGHLPSPMTVWPGLYRIPAGTTAKIRDGSLEEIETYWRPKPPREKTGPTPHLDDQDLDRIAAALTESLEKRLISDAPLCLFLSGGVDSALVAALAAKELDVRIPCITVGFPDTDVDETHYARQVADHLGLDHEVLEADVHQDGEDSDTLIDLFDQPNETTNVVSVRRMAEAAKERGYKVGITGLGGDEVFFGYNKHRFIARHRTLYNMPEAIRTTAGAAARTLGGISSKLDSYARLVGVSNEEIYVARKNHPALPWLRQLPGYPEWIRKEFSDLDPPFDISVPMYELSNHINDSQLRSADRGSMGVALELRTPFLSRELWRIVRSFDPRVWTAHGQKKPLRRLLRRYLPDKLVDRPKQGFIYPKAALLDDENPAPTLSGIPEDLIKEAWDRRHERASWTRLALRLRLAERFIARGQGRSS